MISIKHILKAAGLALAVLAAASCVDKTYDFDRLDKTVTVAGEGIAMPLGSTRQLTVGSLIENNLGDLLTKNADGTYSINYDIKTIGVDLSGLKDIDPVIELGGGSQDPVQFNVWLFDKPDIDFGDASFEGDIDLSDKISPAGELTATAQTLDVTVPNIPSEIVALDGFTLRKGASLKVLVSVPECILTKGAITPEVKVDLSKVFEIEGSSGGVVSISGIVLDQNNGWSAEVTMPLTGVIIDPAKFDAATHSLKLDADVSVSGSYKVENPFTSIEKLKSAPQANNLEVKVEISGMKVDAITGKFDYKADGISSSFDMGNLSDKLGGGDVVLDFSDPEILLTIATNMSIPAKAALNLVASKAGAKIAEVKDVAIVLPVADPGQTASKTIRIAKDGDVKADIASLLKDLPDKIEFEVEAASDATKAGYLRTGADYSIEVTPKVNIPFTFGPGMKMELRDTLSMPSSLSKILKDNPLRLLGEATNTLPVQIDLGVVLTDGSYKALTATVGQVIAASGKSDIDLTLRNTAGNSIENLANAILTLKLTTPSGGAFKSTDYVQADLSAELPEGFTITF